MISAVTSQIGKKRTQWISNPYPKISKTALAPTGAVFLCSDGIASLFSKYSGVRGEAPACRRTQCGETP